ncbi:hypothetical protein D3C85_1347130 [compost metagenome]
MVARASGHRILGDAIDEVFGVVRMNGHGLLDRPVVGLQVLEQAHVVQLPHSHESGPVLRVEC